MIDGIGEYQVNLEPEVTSPDDVFSIRTQNRDFTTYNLSSDEAALFDAQFNTLINQFDSQMTTELFAQRSTIIGNTAALAKQQFDEKMFGGINAGDNEIAFDVIRPGHVRADPADGSIVDNWYYEHEESGYHDWIGDGTSSNDYAVDEDQVTLVLGMMDTGTEIHYLDDEGDVEDIQYIDESFVSGINVDRFGRNVDMLPKDLRDLQNEDNRNDTQIASLPAVVATDRDRVHVRLESDIPPALEDEVAEDNVAIYSQPRLLGITFGVGSWMNTEEYGE